jgi:hypothetical protein
MSKSKSKPLSRLQRIQLQQEKIQHETTLRGALQNHQNPKRAFFKSVKKLHRLQDAVTVNTGETARQIERLFLGLPKRTAQRDAFKELVLHLCRQNCQRLLASRTLGIGLQYIASFWGVTIRDIGTWRRTGYNADRQLLSLVRHLFVKYPVPGFLYKAWLPGGTNPERMWFIEIAAGVSARQLSGLPVVLTKRMACLFLTAPNWCTPTAALRYAQVVSLGGDEWLAWHVNRSYLGQNGFRNDDFWITVIRFLAGVPMLDGTQIDAILGYINHRRALEADFSMKGRTPNALLRQIEAWQDAQNRLRNRGGALQWSMSGIREGVFETAAPADKWFRLVELLSSNELQDEGRAMSHCVYTYARSCARGRCTIFSLRTEDLHTGTQERLATIEVDLHTYRVVQVRARFNAVPPAEHHHVIAAWAEQEGLTLVKWM